MKVTRSVITVVMERLEFSGTKDERDEAVRELAPYDDGWRFISERLVDGVFADAYVREVSRDVTREVQP
jgi:hypothetical protein